MAMTQHLKPPISMSPSSHHTSFIASPSVSSKTHKSSLQFITITSTIPNYRTIRRNPPPFSFKTRTNSQFFSTRRLFLPSVSGIWDAITGGNNPREAIAAIRRGMMLFRQGDVSGSVAEFDKAIELDPRQKAYLWQRGLSLYYLNRFEEGADQFRLDVAQNPNDTEESIWCFLCEAQLYGINEARERFLEVGQDPRPVMREAYNMFKDGGDPEKLAAAFLNGRESDYFYASLYAGLYYEAQNKHDGAKLHIIAACQSPYGQRSDDYMASLAKVHSLCRNWRTNIDLHKGHRFESR